MANEVLNLPDMAGNRDRWMMSWPCKKAAQLVGSEEFNLYLPKSWWNASPLFNLYKHQVPSFCLMQFLSVLGCKERFESDIFFHLENAMPRSTWVICLWAVVALLLFASIRYRQAEWVPSRHHHCWFLLTAKHSHVHGHAREMQCSHQYLTSRLNTCQFRCPGGSCETTEICDNHGCFPMFKCDCNKKPAVGDDAHIKWCHHNEYYPVKAMCEDECGYGTCFTNRYLFCSVPTCWNKYRCDCEKRPLMMGCFDQQMYRRFDKCDVHCDGGSCEWKEDECSELGCSGEWRCNCDGKQKEGKGGWLALEGVS